MTSQFQSKPTPSIKVTVPTKAYLKKFAMWVEARPGEDFISLKGGGVIPYTLRNLMLGKSTLYIRKNETFNLEYNDELKIELPVDFVKRGQMYFDATNITIFNRFLYRIFHEVLDHRIVFANQFKINVKDVIQGFMDELDIEDDIDFDSIKKANYRLRKNRKSLLFRTANSISN